MAASSSTTRTTGTTSRTIGSGGDGEGPPLREIQIVTVKYQCPYCERVYFKREPALTCLSACHARAARERVN